MNPPPKDEKKKATFNNLFGLKWVLMFFMILDSFHFIISFKIKKSL